MHRTNSTTARASWADAAICASAAPLGSTLSDGVDILGTNDEREGRSLLERLCTLAGLIYVSSYFAYFAMSRRAYFMGHWSQVTSGAAV